LTYWSGIIQLCAFVSRKIRKGLPPADSKHAPPAGDNQEVSRAVQVIQAASINMQYLKLEGPPILTLAEKIEPAIREGAAPDGEVKQKKKGGAKKDDA
jgi:hypothetical protein